MPQRRRRAHRVFGWARRAGDRRLGLIPALLAGSLLALAPGAAAEPLEAEARLLARAFEGDAFCLFVPPRPIPGVFTPDPATAEALERDHGLALALEAPLRRAAAHVAVTLAPSEPFDAAMIEAGGPTLVRIMNRLLWLYADYWRTARAVLVEGEPPSLPGLGPGPLRAACEPSVVLFVLGGEEGGTIDAAGWISLLTGRVLARVEPGG